MICKKACFGLLGGLLTLAASKYIFNKYVKKNTNRVLCIEIGGTSSRFAIYNVNKMTKEIKINSDIGFFKKSVSGPIDLVDSIQSIRPFPFPNWKENIPKNSFDKISISAFGPLNLNKSSVDYGMLLSVPSAKKAQWKDQSIVKILKSVYPFTPIIIQTDVNTSAYCEFIERRKEVKTSIAYITVGTGVGVGLVINSKTVTGLMHPEGGHMSLSVDQNKFNSNDNACLHHDSCVESFSTSVYASNSLKVDINDLSDHSESVVFHDIANNIGQLCSNVCLLTSVEKIIIGGGLSQSENFLNRVRNSFKKNIGGYLPLKEEFKNYIELCEDYDTVGIKGAAYLSLEDN